MGWTGKSWENHGKIMGKWVSRNNCQLGLELIELIQEYLSATDGMQFQRLFYDDV